MAVFSIKTPNKETKKEVIELLNQLGYRHIPLVSTRFTCIDVYTQTKEYLIVEVPFPVLVDVSEITTVLLYISLGLTEDQIIELLKENQDEL